MVHTIKFDNRSYHWKERDYNYNVMVAKMGSDYLISELMCRGYMYLNQIYNYFGIRWDLEKENTLIRYRDDYVTGDFPLFSVHTDVDEQEVCIIIDTHDDEEKG